MSKSICKSDRLFSKHIWNHSDRSNTFLIMTNTRLEYVFLLVQQETKKFRTSQPQGDGREFWQPLKQIFKESNIFASSWKQLDFSLVNKLINLEETDELGKIIEGNHFLRQHVRIPQEQSPNLQRTMQIALNSGQYLAISDPFIKIPDFDYYNSGLDRLQTYLFDEDIQSMNLQISDRLLEAVKTYLTFTK